MDTEETKTEQGQADSPTFAQRIESITNEWKESILQDTIHIIEDGRMTEEDVENIVETVIDNSSDLDYKIQGQIDDYDMDYKIETWVDYNLDIEDNLPANRAALTALTAEVAAAFPANAQISFATRVNTKKFNGATTNFDYPGLAKHCSFFFIMACQ